MTKAFLQMTKRPVAALSSMLVFAVAFQTAAVAQQAPPAAGSAQAPNVAPQATTATFGNWTLRCQVSPDADRAAKAAARTCELAQAVSNERQQPVVQLAIGVPPSGENAGQRMFVVRLPVNVRVSRPVELSVSSGKMRLPLPVQFCVVGFCQAEAALSADGLTAFRQKPVPKLEAIFSDSAGQTVTIPLSLEGFDAAWEAYRREVPASTP